MLRKIALRHRKYLESIRVNQIHHNRDLMGYCALATGLLCSCLKKAEWVIADGHCYVKHKNKIIDITAKQFDDKFPKVMVVTEDKFKKRLSTGMMYRWEKRFSGKTVEGLRKQLLSLGWPKKQIPLKSGKISKIVKTEGVF